MPRRKSLGQRLKDERLARNITIKDLSKTILEQGGSTKETTIRSIETGFTQNPGIKTLEEIALGLGLPPLEVMSWALDEPPPEKTQRFSESKFALLWELYESLSPSRKVFWDEVLEMLIERLRNG